MMVHLKVFLSTFAFSIIAVAEAQALLYCQNIFKGTRPTLLTNIDWTVDSPSLIADAGSGGYTAFFTRRRMGATPKYGYSQWLAPKSLYRMELDADGRPVKSSARRILGSAKYYVNQYIESRSLEKNGRSYLYNLIYDPTKIETHFERRIVKKEGDLGQPQKLKIPVDFSQQWRNWFTIVENPQTGVALAFEHINREDKTSDVLVAFSQDGLQFDQVVKVGEGVLHGVSNFGDGYIVAWQDGKVMEQMNSYFRIVRFKDGKVTLGPVQKTTELKNPHDAYPLERADGGADIYFISSQEKQAAHIGGFQTYRRRVLPDGTLGHTETLTTLDEPNLQKPYPQRQKDGTIALTFQRMTDGQKGSFPAYLMILAGDAP